MLNITHYQRNASQNHNEVPSHSGQNGCYQKVYKQEMLGKVWRKGKPLTLLVGMQTSTATIQNSVEIPLKTGNRTAISSVQLLNHIRLCDPVNHSTPGFPVYHQLPEFTQTHVHQVSETIQPSHPLLAPSPSAPNPSQHQSLFQ